MVLDDDWCSTQPVCATVKTISAADANRHFSALSRDVARCDEGAVLSRGKSVATMSRVSHGYGYKLTKRMLLQGRQTQELQKLQR